LSSNKAKHKQKDNIQAPFPKPFEIKVADAIFLKMRNNMVLFKDLSKPNVHYSAFMYGSTFDLHITQENQVDAKKKHVQLLEPQIDWKFLLERMAQDLKANLSGILQKAKTNDPYWQDMEIEYISPEMLKELLKVGLDRNRWNVDEGFFGKLEKSLQYAKLNELADRSIILGWSSEGFLVLSNGIDCWLLDFEKLFKIINKNFELSIRKFRLKYYTSGTIAWQIRIGLLNLNRITVNHLRRR
jgi:hypothetical protein